MPSLIKNKHKHESTLFCIMVASWDYTREVPIESYIIQLRKHVVYESYGKGFCEDPVVCVENQMRMCQQLTWNWGMFS